MSARPSPDRLNVYLYEELLGGGGLQRGRRVTEEKEGKRRREGSMEGTASFQAWPDGQLFGREMRKFVHSGGGRGGQKGVIFSGVESCDSDVCMRNWHGFRPDKFHVQGIAKYALRIYSASDISHQLSLIFLP